MITDFPSNPLVNISGLQLFMFSPYQNVAALPPVVKRKITAAVTFNTGYAFFKGYSTPEQLSFTEKFTPDANGGFYDWQITGYAPGDSDTLADLFDEMMTSRYLVLTKDNAGILRLVGSKAPLIFTVDYDSGRAPGSDIKGYTFTFSGQGRKSAPVYEV